MRGEQCSERVSDGRTEQRSCFGDHDIAVVSVANAQHKRGHTIAGARAQERLHSLFIVVFVVVANEVVDRGRAQRTNRTATKVLPHHLSSKHTPHKIWVAAEVMQTKHANTYILNAGGGVGVGHNFKHTHTFAVRIDAGGAHGVGAHLQIPLVLQPHSVHHTQHLQSQNVLTQVITCTYR
jgi:hypothetical protein